MRHGDELAGRDADGDAISVAAGTSDTMRTVRRLAAMSVREAVEAAARERHDLVTEAARQRPKAWGELAAHGVMAFRRLEGRAASEEERRAIWAGLWTIVEGVKAHERGSP
ncbi:MAG: hypothetical protein ABR525_02490 [Candidatus Limnocylindria bacterium]